MVGRGVPTAPSRKKHLNSRFRFTRRGGTLRPTTNDFWTKPPEHKKNGASEGIRTLDIHVGNVTLYQTELRSLSNRLPNYGMPS